MRVSGLGERGSRLRRIARDLEPAPAVPPYYVQVPDEIETRAVGWYMRRTRQAKPEFLGHSASAAEIWIRELLAQQRPKGRNRR